MLSLRKLRFKLWEIHQEFKSRPWHTISHSLPVRLALFVFSTLAAAAGLFVMFFWWVH
jgi:hypothetical protein